MNGPPMTCSIFRLHLGDSIDGRLDPLLRADFDAHRMRCAACRAELDSIGAVRSGLLALGLPAAPADLWPRLASELIGGDARRAGRWSHLARLGWFRAAALVLVTLTVAAILTRELGPGSRPAGSAASETSASAESAQPPAAREAAPTLEGADPKERNLLDLGYGEVAGSRSEGETELRVGLLADPRDCRVATEDPALGVYRRAQQDLLWSSVLQGIRKEEDGQAATLSTLVAAAEVLAPGAGPWHAVVDRVRGTATASGERPGRAGGEAAPRPAEGGAVSHPPAPESTATKGERRRGGPPAALGQTPRLPTTTVFLVAGQSADAAMLALSSVLPAEAALKALDLPFPGVVPPGPSYRLMLHEAAARRLVSEIESVPGLDLRVLLDAEGTGLVPEPAGEARQLVFLIRAP
jgi:hypothetical protein